MAGSAAAYQQPNIAQNNDSMNDGYNDRGRQQRMDYPMNRIGQTMRSLTSLPYLDDDEVRPEPQDNKNGASRIVQERPDERPPEND